MRTDERFPSFCCDQAIKQGIWIKKNRQAPKRNLREVWPLWLLEHCLDFQNWISPSLWLIMQAALDNFWNFIQMNYSDPGWSNINGDVTDLRSMHLLPVCGLWIIRGPVGPRSSDLCVKEFEIKGSCITVNTLISSKNPFTAQGEGTGLFNICLWKSTQKRRGSDWSRVQLKKVSIWNECLQNKLKSMYDAGGWWFLKSQHFCLDAYKWD